MGACKTARASTRAQTSVTDGAFVPIEAQQGAAFASADTATSKAQREKHPKSMQADDIPDSVLPLDVLITSVQAFGNIHRFSQREQDILLLLVRGAHPKVVGDLIGCSYATVRTHLRRMYKKLGCSGTREVVVRFF